MSSAFLTDRYELTMLAAALRDGTASRPSVFELFSRRLCRCCASSVSATTN
jgi:nicotinate phosphoribosyltransferase